VWDQVIDAEKHAENLDLQIEDPHERLKILSAQEPAKDKLVLKKLRADLKNDTSIEGLNPSQKQAINAALGRRLSLVQGPPGTGKTHVSVRLLQSWTQKLGIWPVLATSDSNIAVDNLAEGAHALGLNVVRVGRPEKVTPQTEQILLEAILRRRRAAAQSEALKASKTSEAKPRGSIAKMLVSTGSDDEDDGETPVGKRDDDWDDYNEKMKLLREADVICCTTNASGSNFFKNLNFGAILVDEAAQATELSTIVPIVLQGAEQLVLVGDHCQLPPSIACFEAEVRGLSLSLFGRLAAQGINPFFLDTQFRMHPMIAAFSAREFYLGKLNTGVDESDRPPPAGFPWPLDDKGIAFLHVDGPESADGQSKQNDNEAAQVAELLKDVLAAGELTYADIGVITPYSSQVRKLREKIRGGMKWQTGAAKTDVQALEIASVDAFQGREKELIIFSAVRSNKRRNVGFLADWRRLNVMITRARRGLIIVGDTGTLRSDKTWQRWLSWADEQCLFVHKAESDVESLEYDEENDPLILGVLQQAAIHYD
jgi:superfamily I DNA and/or RNA helicase